MIAGVEEAGRGPVIGPMVMAIVVIDEADEQKLVDAGVKDSKLLSPAQREALFETINSISKEHLIKIIPPDKVDGSLNDPSMNLNWLEAKTSAYMINKLNIVPDKVILDCPSNNIPAYTDYVKERITNKNIKIVAEHKADLNHPVVSAASILAKVTRDREIEKLKKKYNIDFGSGYPSDPRTKEFLEKNYDKYNFFRKTWASYKNVLKKKNSKQSLLGEF